MEKKNVPSLVKDQQLIHKRREQIIKGAVRLFIEKGFHRMHNKGNRKRIRV